MNFDHYCLSFRVLFKLARFLYTFSKTCNSKYKDYVGFSTNVKCVYQNTLFHVVTLFQTQ